LPGVALAASVAVCSYLGARLLGPLLPIPAIVVALLIGIAVNPLVTRPLWTPGLEFCVKVLLRVVVALLGLRIAFGDVVSLGGPVALLLVVATGVTFAAGFAFARALNLSKGFGALSGAATAICGASATLAVASAMPDYKGKHADVVLVVIAANVVSTVAMLAYPQLCALLGLDATATGILLGATIHDVAQVVGAGYSVSEPVGETAVIVKLFRVLLLLPIVLVTALLFRSQQQDSGNGRVAMPMFAVAFFLLSILNSVLSSVPSLLPIYLPVKAILGEVSTWGLLIAIAALGLGTAPGSLTALGWRHLTTFLGVTTVILLFVIAVLYLPL